MKPVPSPFWAACPHCGYHEEEPEQVGTLWSTNFAWRCRRCGWEEQVDWCYSCDGRCRKLRAFIQCFECKHNWTRWRLWWAYNKDHYGIRWADHHNPYSEGWGGGWRALLTLPVRLKHIYFCPLCIHDW